MADLPFDLSRMDYDGIRLRRRKRLLVWSLPVVFLVLCLVAGLLTPFLLMHQVTDDYKARNFKDARSLLSLLLPLSPETYVAAYNVATTDSQYGQFDRAETEFQKALAFAPVEKQCLIRQNMVLMYERRGDEAMRNLKYEDAITYYTKGVTTVQANERCFDGRDDQARLEKKKEIAQEAARSSAKTTNDSQTQSEDSIPSQSAQDKLSDVERKAAQQRQEDKNSSQPYSDSFDNSDIKKW